MEEIKKKHKTWIEIDRSAIKNNYDAFRALLKPETKLMAVVKSNAYGHGMVSFAKEIESLGADFLAVDDAREAFTLVEEGIKKPILILNYIEEDLLKDVVSKGIHFTVSNFNMLDRAIALKDFGPKIHIKVDTGLGRQGFLSKDREKLLNIILENNLKVDGLYTHYSIAESPERIDYTKKQTEEFKIWVKAFEEAGLRPLKHAAAASGAILGEEYHFDMVRIGIGLYGHWGSRELKEWAGDRVTLRQIMTWKTIVSEIKDVPKGSFIGYDLRKCLEEDSKMAIIPVGYWHGLTGIMTNEGEVLIKGKRAKIHGRVAMDMTILNVSHIPDVQIGDEVVLLGFQGDDCISTDEVKYRFDMINYEFVTRINPQIPRIYK